MQHILVNSFMAHSDTVSITRRIADLFRTPLVSQPALDPLPVLRRNAGLMTTLAAGQGQLLSLLRPVTAQPAVASVLLGDRSLVGADHLGNLRLLMTRFHQGLNLVTLGFGELRVVSHLCLSFHQERKAQMLTQLASYSDPMSCT